MISSLGVKSLMLFGAGRCAAAFTVPAAGRVPLRRSLASATAPLLMNRPAVVPRTVPDELVELYNTQVTNELEASQLYLAASIWCENKDLVGMAAFMRSESDDEREHALRLIDFANKRNIPIKLEDIEAPDCDWGSPEEMWEDLLTGEMENTEALLAVTDAAAKSNLHAVTTFFQPYHMEQVDAEDKLRTILAKVRDENKTPGLLRQLDYELGTEAKSG